MSGTTRIRPTAVTVDLAALRANFATLTRRGGGKPICAVVKADAYGHGATVIAKELEKIGCAWLAVTLVEEGMVLREAGVGLPILVLGGAFGEDGFAAVVDNDLTPVIWTTEHLDELAKAAAGRDFAYHFKVDTGMSRLGAKNGEVQTFLAHTQRYPHLVLDGFMSHFANADVVGDVKNATQIATYLSALKDVRDNGQNPSWIHIANTPSTLTGVHGNVHTLLRPGGGLYGLDTRDKHPNDVPLKPVLTWTTKPVHVKRIALGASVSYGARWTARRDSVIATLPVGYADGYPRIMTAKAHTLVKGRIAPVVGTICMDLCLIDVTDIPDVTTHDEVVLIGAQDQARITADDLAGWAGTISYEITCGIGPRVPRRYASAQEAVVTTDDTSDSDASTPLVLRSHEIGMQGPGA